MTGRAWSTIKVPVILARYRLADSRHESWATINPVAALAITESDNAAAQELFDQIASAEGGVSPASRYVAQELRAAGDEVTQVNTVPPNYGYFSTYGQTPWSLNLGTAFYRQLARGCVPPHDATAHVLGLMAEVIPSQRWGVGAVHWSGASALYFKGGWGPDPAGRYLVRQFGIIEGHGGRGFVVGLLAEPDNGAFGSGVTVLDDLAASVARNVRLSSTPAFARCGG
jgi:hypothetical protein